MKKLKLILLAAALCFGAGKSLAIPITGGIAFVGGYVPNNPNLTLATKVAFTWSIVADGTGDYAAIPFGTWVTWSSPLVFDPPTPPAGPLWDLGGGVSFDAGSISVDSEAPTSLVLSGTGTLHFPGRDDTSGNWVGTFNSTGGAFSFSAGSAATGGVPDAGNTAMLLSVVLTGLGTWRRWANVG